MLTLEIKKRDIKQKISDLRAEGLIPAVYYGRKDESTPISIKETDFVKVWKQAGESTVITLKDESKDIDSLIYEVQKDPLTEKPLHADFYAFEKGQKLKISVPIEFVGEAPAVKAGGVLVKVIHEVEVEAEPKNLPHSIKVDISSLVDFDSQISAGDIILPEGVVLEIDPEDVVASVYEPVEEVEEAVAATFDPNAIEVEKKGKEESEDGGESPDKKDDK